MPKKSEVKKNKFGCTVCGAKIIYHRIDDGENVVEIQEDGSVLEIGSESNGSTEVYCSNDRSHKINEDLFETIVDIAEGYGY